MKRRLIGYVVLEKPANSKELRDYLRERLPFYMVPNVMVKLDALPISNSWKLGKLPKPEDIPECILHGEMEEAVGEIEPILVDLFKEVLEISESMQISTTDNFFDLGGNSFSLSKLYSHLETQSFFNNNITLSDIYEVWY